MIYYTVADSYTLPSPAQFRQDLEAQIWPNLTTYVTLSLGISLVIFMFSKIAG